MTLTTYDEIREDVVSCADSTLLDKLDEFKTTYRLLINSARTTSRIKNFRELVAVLEKRRCLTKDNVEVLHDIASSLRDSAITGRVKEYELNSPGDKARGYVESPERCASETLPKVARVERDLWVGRRNPEQPQQKNGYSYGPLEQPCYNPQPCAPPLYPGYRNWATAPAYVPHLPAEVVEVISEEIGSAWKSFARHIAVKEGEIDELITRSDMSIKEKLVKCLVLFEKRTRYVDVKKTLHAALCKVRRNDVSEDIEHMLIQAGF